MLPLSSRIARIPARSKAVPLTAPSTSLARTTMLKYISPDELAALMKSDKVVGRDYCVVDVRDDDWYGGNIKGSQNSPSYKFLDKVSDLVTQTKDVPTVIFHCALSQVRGPKAARIYSETRDLLQTQGADKPHDVFVLRGGFQDFQAKYKGDPALVENWKDEVWGSGLHF